MSLAATRFCRLLCMIPFLALSACGGGGGGGGADGENARTGIRIVQGSIDVAPLDLYDAGQLEATVRQAKFAIPSQYGALEEGVHSIVATRANRPNDRFTSHQVNVSEGERFTLLTFGNVEGLGLSSRVISDIVPELDGQAGVRIVHGLAGAERIVATGASLGSSVAVSYGQDSGYKTVAPGPTKITVTRATDGKVLGTVSFDAFGGEAYSIFAVGEVDLYATLRVVSDSE